MAEAGSLGGGMLSYFARFASCSAESCDLVSLRLRLNFRLKAAAENDDAVSDGATRSSGFKATEKLGALGPLGLV